MNTFWAHQWSSRRMTVWWPTSLFVVGKLSLLFLSIVQEWGLTMCNHSHPSHFITHVQMDDSTSNLVKHVAHCQPTTGLENNIITMYANGHTYNAGQMHFLLAKWVSHHFHPFLIIEDPELITIFWMLYGHVQIPSASTVSHDIKEIFVMSKICMKNLLQVCCLHLAVCTEPDHLSGTPRKGTHHCWWLDVTCHQTFTHILASRCILSKMQSCTNAQFDTWFHMVGSFLLWAVIQGWNEASFFVPAYANSTVECILLSS